MIFEYLITIAVIFSVIGYLPQIIKMIKVKDSRSVSSLTYIIWLFVTGIMAIHAVRIQDIYFTVAQGCQFIACIIAIVLCWKYK